MIPPTQLLAIFRESSEEDQLKFLSRMVEERNDARDELKDTQELVALLQEKERINKRIKELLK